MCCVLLLSQDEEALDTVKGRACVVAIRPLSPRKHRVMVFQPPSGSLAPAVAFLPSLSQEPSKLASFVLSVSFTLILMFSA